MAFQQRKPRPTKPIQAKTTDPRAELARAMLDAGQLDSACGVCGATVRADDPEAEQTTRQVGTYPYIRTVRSWRYHRVCYLAKGGPELLALALDPDARPIRVTQAHADVARRIGVPLAYRELETSSATDRGKTAWRHVLRAELDELRAAVAKRHAELTEPVHHSSGWPCSVCGRSHELVDTWTEHRGRPACGECVKLIERAAIPRNRTLEEYALDEARPSIPPRSDLRRFGLAHQAASYRPLTPDERREPWSYVADLPETPPTTEQLLAARLAELEKLAGVAG